MQLLSPRNPAAAELYRARNPVFPTSSHVCGTSKNKHIISVKHLCEYLAQSLTPRYNEFGVTSVPAWRDTLRAETYEGYFDFKQLSISAVTVRGPRDPQWSRLR